MQAADHFTDEYVSFIQIQKDTNMLMCNSYANNAHKYFNIKMRMMSKSEYLIIQKR